MCDRYFSITQLYVLIGRASCSTVSDKQKSRRSQPMLLTHHSLIIKHTLSFSLSLCLLLSFSIKHNLGHSNFHSFSLFNASVHTQVYWLALLLTLSFTTQSSVTDQMGILFVQYLGIYNNNENLPKSIKNLQKYIKKFANTKQIFKNGQQFFNFFLPKW